MGPPPFGDGNQTGGVGRTVWYCILQWGHRLSAMETSPSPCPGYSPSWDLQWGHRLSAMETRADGVLRCQICGPSMGPPPFGDGNWAANGGVIYPIDPFNGATAFRRWKLGRVGIAPYPRLHSFNGATAFRRWKLGLAVNETSRRYVLQWGHRLSAMETSSPA